MVKRRVLAGGLILFLLLRLLPGFAAFWQEAVSLPLLQLLESIGSRVPFSILEWGALVSAVLLAAALLRRRFMKHFSALLLALVIAYLSLWYPLYFAGQPTCTANPTQVAALCEAFIDTLNASPPDFSEMPPLPAKYARFPLWMDVLGICGFCSFFTGEALVSPSLPSALLPFTALHERMHMRGIAGEGAANIAAYEACMELGGPYAASARLWALRCGMGTLYQTDHALYSRCMQRMNVKTLRLFRESGGAYLSASPSLPMQALYSLLGISTPVRDYEILVPYLAARFPE